jgi:ubiquinone/menaquinone biosynthesis C-methylase UbiE
LEATHGEHEHSGHDLPHDSEPNWQSQQFVDDWLQRQDARAPERRRQFVVMRALIPKRTDEEFTYINLGAGAGNLDEVLLEHFVKARATLVDGSQAMLDSAEERLKAYSDRAEFVVADLSQPDWMSGVSSPFDVAVSSFAAHHAGGAERVRELYGEIYGILEPGGIFVNLEYVRPARPDIVALSTWAAQDPDAQLNATTPRHALPGTMIEQIGWLSEAGFSAADAMWKNLNVVCFGALKGPMHLLETHAS